MKLNIEIEKLMNGYVVEVDGDRRIFQNEKWIKEYLASILDRFIVE